MHSLQDIHQAIVQLQPHWSLSLDHVEFLSDGYANANYAFTHEGQQYVLRMPHIGMAANTSAIDYLDTANEVALHRLLKQHTELELAPLVANDVSSGRLLTEYRAGPLLADTKPAVADVILYTQHLHQQLRPVAAPSPYPLQQLIQTWLPAPPPWLQRWLAATAWLPAKQCCHNDLNPWNIIAQIEQPARWITLDWETAGTHDPLFDAICLHQGLAFPTSQLAEFCQAVLVDVPSSQELTLGIRLYWLREYAWAFNQVQKGNGHPEVAVQQDTALAKLANLVTQ